MPVFVLDKENLMSSLYSLSGLQDIDFKKHTDFSKRFFLSGEDKKAIRAFFTKDLIFFFESHPLYYIESKGDSILIRGKERLASIQEIKQMLAFSEQFLKLLEAKKG